MKFLGILVGVFALVATAEAAPISCGTDTSTYAVVVSNDMTTATVTENGEVPMFGELVCQSLRNEGGIGHAFLECHSPNVADAGFSAYFAYTSAARATVRLSEISFVGTTPVATLPCVMAMNGN